MAIEVLIVEDNCEARSLLKYYLNKLEDVQLVGEAQTCVEAIARITEMEPEVVFLDMELPDGNGLDILAHFHYPKFKVIVVTGYNSYAIRALRLAAIDYILKPPSEEEIVDALSKADKLLHEDHVQYTVLKDYLSQSPDLDRLVIPSDSSKRSLKFEEIVYLRSDGGYTIFYTHDQRHIITSKPISYFEEILPANFFFRSHKSFIVNFKYVKTIPSGRGGDIDMGNDFCAKLSVRKAAAFRKWYKERTL